MSEGENDNMNENNDNMFNSFQQEEGGIDFEGDSSGEQDELEEEKELNISMNFGGEEIEDDNEKEHLIVDDVTAEVEENQEEDKIEINKDIQLLPITPIPHPQSEKNLHNKNKPSLCELILENINKKHSKHGSMNLATSPDKAEKIENPMTVTMGTENFERISTNDSHNLIASSGFIIKVEGVAFSPETLNQAENEKNIDSFSANISATSSNNSLIHSVQKKVPILLNNLKTMFDLNSDRVRKRSEQMKKRKEKLEENGEDAGMPVNQNLMANFNSVGDNILSKHENSSNHHRRGIKLSANKKYKDEDEEIDEKQSSLLNSSENPITKVFSESNGNSSNNLHEIVDVKEFKEEPEVVVSDLDCEIEGGDPATVHTSSNTKSFIPLQNHLRSKRAVSVDKATPSYLMALYQYEDNGESNKNSLNNSLNAGGNEFNQDGTGDNNYFINLAGNTRHNYQVDDVIEEETSENNTDTELSARKRSSLYFYGARDQRSGDSGAYPNAYSSSPTHNMKRFNLTYGSNFNTAHKLSYNTHQESRPNSDVYEIKLLNDNHPLVSYNSNESQRSSMKCKRKGQHHKSSKSELTNFKVDMKKMLDNLEKRKLSEEDDRMNKLQLRKKILLNKFIKSNSQHNLPPQSNITIGSNNSIKRNSEKTLSICTGSQIVDNMFKRLSPSGASREKFYYDYVEDKDKLKLNFEEDENQHYIEHEEAEGEVVQNKSIIEIRDEDVNFEAELNNQMEKNEMLEDELIDHSAFNFNNTPFESHKNTAEKKYKKKSVFESEDMKISQGDKFDVVQNLEMSVPGIKPKATPVFNSLSMNNFNFSTNMPNSSVPVQTSNITITNNSQNSINNKSIIITDSSNNFLEILNNQKKSSNPFVISSDINLQITPEISEEFPKTIITNQKTVYNNNYINNNINNISISIVNNNNEQSSTPSSNKITSKKPMTRQKNNSITHDIRQKYMGHYKTPSICMSKIQTSQEEKVRSNSVSKNITSSQISIAGLNSVNCLNSPLNPQSSQGNIDFTSNQKSKKSLKQSGMTTPKKNKFITARGDLKHFLMYSETKLNDNNNSNHSKDISGLSNMNSLNSFNNLLSSHIQVESNPRVNSETSVNNILSSNKQIIQDAMKVLKFQTSSLDHQKFTLDKLHKSKAKLFCLLIAKDTTESHFEYKGLYEMNIEKNSLTKIYSVNYYPNNIDFNEVKSFYQFSYETESFKVLSEIKRFSSDIHGFYMHYNYKKFLKG